MGWDYSIIQEPCFVCNVEDNLGEKRGTQSHPINCGWRVRMEQLNTEQLEVKVMDILRRKLNELAEIDPNLIDSAILEEEVDDAANIWILLRSINPHNKLVKLKQVQTIVSQTTSASIYELLKEVK